ncbi:MAG: TIGR02452 family protein [Oscillospiraceae bacterium]|nr:TIGR02452 family protein [Oscillospiraceae bacterium]
MFDLIRIKRENDNLYEIGTFDGQYSEYVPDIEPTGHPREDNYRICDHTEDLTTVGCILAHADKDILALNFANANVAGGGYIIGARAQEEDICRASGLYYTIRDTVEFYNANRFTDGKGYTHGMILSYRVPVIRDDRYNMLETPVRCGFITSPAVNRYACRLAHSKVNAIMEERIRRIITIAVQKRPEVLILGKYGCGAFGNNWDEVAPMFENAINELTGGSDMEIIFALPSSL